MILYHYTSAGRSGLHHGSTMRSEQWMEPTLIPALLHLIDMHPAIGKVVFLKIALHVSPLQCDFFTSSVDGKDQQLMQQCTHVLASQTLQFRKGNSILRMQDLAFVILS